MASYHDKRPSHSDGYHSRSSASRRSQRSREHSPETSRSRPEVRYATSSRYPTSSQYPPRAASSRSAHPPNSAVKRPWPPAPAVEDDKDSLASSDISETPSRGSVDQQPIFLEMQLPIRPTPPKSSSINKERLPRRNGPADLPASANKQTRGRSESTQTGLELPETPLFARREPSPYSYKPPAYDTSTNLSTDSGYFSDKRKESGLGIDNLTSDALRGEGRARNSHENDQYTTYSSRDANGTADDAADESTFSARSTRAPAPYSYSRSNLPDKGARPASRDFAKVEPQPRLAEIKAEALEPKRHGSESVSNSYRPQFETRHSTPYPLELSMPAQSSGRSSGSRPSSPSDKRGMPSHSPPRSPRVAKTDSPHSARSSVSGSVSGSRPSSPVAGAGPNTLRPEEGIRRSSTFPIAPEDRSQRPSRLSSTYHVDDTHSAPPSRKPSALPYPVDEVYIMPSEEDQRYNAQALGEPFVPRPSVYPPRPSTRDSPLHSPVAPRPASIEMPTGGLVFPARQILDTNLPAVAATTAALASPREPESPLLGRASVLGSTRPRPRCAAHQNDRNFIGWFGMINWPNLEFCPGCYERYIASTIFARHFQQVYRREANPNVVCSLSTPWIKLAWKLTLQRQRSDLNLIFNVAQISDLELPCPGPNRETRAWHTLYDRQGYAVPGFDVCPCDVKRIEALMPSLRGLFQESSNSGRKRKCNLRTTSNRFKEYMDLLVEIDTSSDPRSGPPDATDLIELAHHKAQMRECLRDDLILDQGWHFAPQLPEFTVCEECYSAVVWPAIADNSSVACKFKRTPEWLDEETAAGGASSSRSAAPPLPGISCQLYSDRMRQVFWRAVESEDFAYLAKRAQERKRVELDLHGDMAAITAELKDLEKLFARAGDRQLLESHPRHISLLNEIGKISERWRKWE